MRNRIWLCCLSAALLLIVLSVWIFSEEEDLQAPFSVQFWVDGEMEGVLCHRAEDGSYYVFLPSFAELSTGTILLHTKQALSIASISLTDGMSCDALETDMPYDFAYGDCKSSITFCSAVDIPTMCIETETGNMEYIHAKKGNSETVAVHLYDSNGRLSYTSTDAVLQGRGNYTWTEFDKKPYSLTLPEEASLLEMGAATRWVLLANAADASQIRNKLVYDFATNIGLAFSPESRWVEIYLNGDYAGLYLLCERNEIHPERVNVDENGSFLVSAELESRLKKQGYSYLTTPSGQTMRLHSPENVEQEQLQGFQEVLRAVEGAIFSDDGIDPDSGKPLEELIDLDSWAKKYLIEEIFGNIDACLISQYYYYDTDTHKMFAGPVWDYDVSLGSNVNWDIESPYVFMASKLRVSEASSTSWFVELYQNELFYTRLTELFETLFVPQLQQLLDYQMEHYNEQIKPVRIRDELRWGKEGVSEEEIECIRSYLAERIKFLSEIWIDQTELCFVKLEQGLTAYYAVPYGQCPEVLPEPRHSEGFLFLGWYYVDTDEPFDISKPITEDITLYAKWDETGQSKLSKLLQLIPCGMMTGVFLLLLFVECRKYRRQNRR